MGPAGRLRLDYDNTVHNDSSASDHEERWPRGPRSADNTDPNDIGRDTDDRSKPGQVTTHPSPSPNYPERPIRLPRGYGLQETSDVRDTQPPSKTLVPHNVWR